MASRQIASTSTETPDHPRRLMVGLAMRSDVLRRAEEYRGQEQAQEEQINQQDDDQKKPKHEERPEKIQRENEHETTTAAAAASAVKGGGRSPKWQADMQHIKKLYAKGLYKQCHELCQQLLDESSMKPTVVSQNKKTSAPT